MAQLPHDLDFKTSVKQNFSKRKQKNNKKYGVSKKVMAESHKLECQKVKWHSLLDERYR